MKLYLPNNHIVVNIQEEYYIVDTGSPISFSFLSKKEIEINDIIFQFNNTIGCSKKVADELTNMNISGFIGLDILRQTNLCVDFADKTLFFDNHFLKGNELHYSGIPFSLFQSMYIITSSLYLGKQLNNAIIDSGARISYLSSRLLPLLECSDEMYSDISPEYGALEGYYYYGDLKHVKSDDSRHIKVGQLPEMLDVFGLFDAIIGVTDLTDSRLIIDFDLQFIFTKDC